MQRTREGFALNNLKGKDRLAVPFKQQQELIAGAFPSERACWNAPWMDYRGADLHADLVPK